MWTQHSYMAEHFWSEQIRHSLLRHCLNWKWHSGRSFIKSILIEVFLGVFRGWWWVSHRLDWDSSFLSVGCVYSGPSLFRSRDWVRHRSERLCMWGSGSNIAALKFHFMLHIDPEEASLLSYRHILLQILFQHLIATAEDKNIGIY